MWGLLLFPLLVAIFLGVALVAIIAALVFRPKRPLTRTGLLAAPFGCAALPLLAILSVAGMNSLLQKSDARLFQEIYGFVPEMREDQMLSDDFGTLSDRWIYMKLEPTADDRGRILAVAPRQSGLTAEQFANHGRTHQFTWWDVQCGVPDIRDASGYRDWQQLTVYDCPETNRVFIVAFRQ